MCEQLSLYTEDACLLTWRSRVWDFVVIGAVWKATTFVDPLIAPENISLPHPWLYTLAKFVLWCAYGYVTGLFATGLWVCAHECGHQAFSESKFVNNSIGWILHSG